MDRRRDDAPPASTVFVGNLSFDLTEQDVINHFSQVGPVKHVRIVTDRESGKPRGFGFIEFFDIPTAESAIRNLSGKDFNGRTIRIVYADGGPFDHRSFDDRDHRGDRDRGPPPHGGGGRGYDDRGGPPGGPMGRRPMRDRVVGGDLAYHASHGVAALLDAPLLPGAPADALTHLLARRSRAELYDYLAQMKGLLQKNPGQARAILADNPQLTKALFQMQVILGMVSNPLGDVAPKGVAPPNLMPRHEGHQGPPPPLHHGPPGPGPMGGPPGGPGGPGPDMMGGPPPPMHHHHQHHHHQQHHMDMQQGGPPPMGGGMPPPHMGGGMPAGPGPGPGPHHMPPGPGMGGPPVMGGGMPPPGPGMQQPGPGPYPMDTSGGGGGGPPPMAQPPYQPQVHGGYMGGPPGQQAGPGPGPQQGYLPPEPMMPPQQQGAGPGFGPGLGGPQQQAVGGGQPVDPRRMGAGGGGGGGPPRPMMSEAQQQQPQPMPGLPQQQQQQQQPMAPALAPGGGAGMSAEQQQALLQQVMSLTPQQIELLPPAHKAQVLALQQQLRGGQ